MEKDPCRGLYTWLLCDHSTLFLYFLPFCYPYILLHFKCSLLLVKLWSHFDKNERHKTVSLVMKTSQLDYLIVYPCVCVCVSPTPYLLMDRQNFLASHTNHWPSLWGWPCLQWGDHASAAISMDHLSPSRRDSTSLSQRELMLMFCVYCFWCSLLSAALYWGVTVPDGELARLRDWTWQGYEVQYHEYFAKLNAKSASGTRLVLLGGETTVTKWLGWTVFIVDNCVKYLHRCIIWCNTVRVNLENILYILFDSLLRLHDCPINT